MLSEVLKIFLRLFNVEFFIFSETVAADETY